MKKNLVLLVLLLGALTLPTAVHAQNIYGDVNGDGTVNITDVNSIISIILDGKTMTPAADVNSDGTVNIADVNVIINIILGGGSHVLWYLVTDAEQVIEMSRVCSLVATDTEDTFSILDSQGNILAKDVLKATFTQSPTRGIKKVEAGGNMLESVVDNVLTLIGVEGDIEIFNNNGIRMLCTKATNQETHIVVSHFTSGVYLVKCGTQTFKFNKK